MKTDGFYSFVPDIRIMNQNIKDQIQAINQYIDTLTYGEHPNELYEPLSYIMSLGGKRLRPLLCLLSYQLFQKDWERILPQATSIEVFHNFTLMHDDIMDDAPLRRGKPTVHEKWNDSTAILSGDVMLVKAYDLLLEGLSIDPAQTIRRFNKCASEVCEGQQIDMNFESDDNVDIDSYIEMIRLKTAVLLGYSLELGALLAQADQNTSDQLRQFGELIGIGFQLKDDLLDVYADQGKFGKQVGGDIIANKKTFLLLTALQLADDNQRKSLNEWIQKTEFNAEEKVKQVTAIYDEIGIRELTLKKMNEYFDKGLSLLQQISASDTAKHNIIEFTQYLIDRDK